jgi:hypothetical protein
MFVHVLVWIINRIAIYMWRSTVARSRWPTCSCQQWKTVYWCHGNPTVGSFCTFVELKILRPAINNINVLRSCYKSASFFFCVWLSPDLEFHATYVRKKISNIIFHENPSSGSRADTCGQTNTMELIAAFRDLVERLWKVRADWPMHRSASNQTGTFLIYAVVGFL